MAGTNPDTPTEALSEFPEMVDEARLVGVDATGVPIYFDETNERTFEALRSEGSWVVGEERTAAELANVISHVDQVTDWDALTPYGSGEEE